MCLLLYYAVLDLHKLQYTGLDVHKQIYTSTYTMSSDKMPFGWGWVNKLPGNPNTKSFLASMIVIGVVCVPKFIMERNKKQGHGYFDSEMPEDIRKNREGKCFICSILSLRYYLSEIIIY